jgi:DNA polymerase-3 subunit epsilon
MDVSQNRCLVFVDLETTGANPAVDRITEIGIVRVTENGVQTWSSLVNPDAPIPKFIIHLTGINDEMVAAAPRFGELANEVLALLQGCLFVAHNVRFDYGFLRHEFKRAGLDFRADVLCTVKLSRKLFPQHHKHNLGALIERHGLPLEARHRALGDARAIHAFWEKIHVELPGEAIAAALAELLHIPVFPEGFDASVLDDLPELQGVYTLYGEGDKVLYVGHGANLRRQVLGHFSEKAKKPGGVSLSESLRRVECVETAGELGRSLLEARLIRTLHPEHNRRSGRQGELCSLKLETAKEGGLRVRLVREEDCDFALESDLYGLFPTRKKALDSLREIAKAHRLCWQALGLEETPASGQKPCSSCQDKICKGLCVGRETSAQHDMRLIAALARMKVNPWPYEGPVGIRETASWGGVTQIHVIDRWRYLGSVASEDELDAVLNQTTEFDLNTYKLLNRYLNQPGVKLFPIHSR